MNKAFHVGPLKRHTNPPSPPLTSASKVQAQQLVLFIISSKVPGFSSSLFACLPACLPSHDATRTKTHARTHLQDRKETRTTIRLSEGVSDWIEMWSPEVFRKVGYGMAAGCVAVGALGSPTTGLVAAVPVGM